MAKSGLPKFQKFLGVNNVKKPWELKPSELAVATNVDLTDSGRLLRRPGRTKLLSGSFSSLWSTPGLILAVSDGNLASVRPDFSGVNVLLAGVGDLPMSFAKVNDIAVFSNSMVLGYVRDGKAEEFPIPTDNYKLMLIPGQLVEYFRGRLLIARENVVWYSDVMAQRFGSLDPRGNGRQLPSKILMMKAVDDGVWLSDEAAIYFAEGLDPYSWKLTTVKNYPAIPGMATEIDSELLPFLPETVNDNVQMPSRPALTGPCYMVGTANGVCVLGNSGYIHNATEKYYQSTPGASGAMVFHRSVLNRVISVTNP